MNRNVIHDCSGAILIYVLWILVVISTLAFQLAQQSRVVVVNQAAQTRQLKTEMQLKSALEFARFQVIGNQWKDRDFLLEINNQRMKINILNEAGFISIYNLSSKSLKSIFELVKMEPQAIDALTEVVESKQNPRFLNNFHELTEIEGVDELLARRLAHYTSVFHTDSASPYFAPSHVLMELAGVDRYLVGQLREEQDIAERLLIRQRLAEILSAHGDVGSDVPAVFFRVIIELENVRYRVFVRFDQRQESFKVVYTDRVPVALDQQYPAEQST
jgi:hypothetical protein